MTLVLGAQHGDYKYSSNEYTSDGVQAFQVVYVHGADTVAAANAENETHAGRVVGISLHSADAGKRVIVADTGMIENYGWSLVEGKIYYLSTGGNISVTPSEIGFVQKIGVAVNEYTLFLQIEGAVILRG